MKIWVLSLRSSEVRIIRITWIEYWKMSMFVWQNINIIKWTVLGWVVPLAPQMQISSCPLINEKIDCLIALQFMRLYYCRYVEDFFFCFQRQCSYWTVVRLSLLKSPKYKTHLRCEAWIKALLFGRLNN